jgi:hypothetical protein
VVRRNRPPDPLRPLPVATWLVVRDMSRRPLEWRRLAAGLELRAILGSVRDERMSAGWTCDDIGPLCNFFFAERGGKRLFIGVERYDPAGPGPLGHSEPTPRK